MPMARFTCANLAIVGLTAQVAIFGVVAMPAGPASAQSDFFGDAPPRPPSSVPTRQGPTRVGPPPAQYGAPPAQYGAQPEPLPPPPGAAAAPMGGTAAAPMRGLGSGVESQPLPPPPGGVVDRGRAPTALQPQPPAIGPQGGPAPPPAGGRAGLTPPSGGAANPPAEGIVLEPPAQRVANPTAVFSGLDKITGRITAFEVAMNETVQFGALRVRPRACFTRPPTEAPNTTGFIEVDEVTLQGDLKRLFRGWMFAASPGLHGVEHPIYDVWLSDCKGAQTAAVEEPAPQPAPPPPQSHDRTQTPRASRQTAPQRQPR